MVQDVWFDVFAGRLDIGEQGEQRRYPIARQMGGITIVPTPQLSEGQIAELLYQFERQLRRMNLDLEGE